MLVFFFWMILDLIGLITFIKLVNEPRKPIIKIALKSFIRNEYLILSLSIELIGFITLLYSFSIPWYYNIYLDWGRGEFIRYDYAKDVINLEVLQEVFLFYTYYLSLVMIFAKIAINLKIHPFTALELLELILIIPIFLLINNIIPLFCLGSAIPERSCLKSGYSSGFILFFFGTSALIINGVQISFYKRRMRGIAWMTKVKELLHNRKSTGLNWFLNINLFFEIKKFSMEFLLKLEAEFTFPFLFHKILRQKLKGLIVFVINHKKKIKFIYCKGTYII